MNLFFNNLKNLFSADYWFDLTPEPFLPYIANILYLFFILLIIVGFACNVMLKKNKKNIILFNIYGRFYYFFITLGFSGLVITFFRAQRVNFLGAPFWFLVWLLILLVWLIYIIRYIKIKIPKIKESIELKKEMEKYLPKK